MIQNNKTDSRFSYQDVISDCITSINNNNFITGENKMNTIEKAIKGKSIEDQITFFNNLDIDQIRRDLQNKVADQITDYADQITAKGFNARSKKFKVTKTDVQTCIKKMIESKTLSDHQNLMLCLENAVGYIKKIKSKNLDSDLAFSEKNIVLDNGVLSGARLTLGNSITRKSLSEELQKIKEEVDESLAEKARADKVKAYKEAGLPVRKRKNV